MIEERLKDAKVLEYGLPFTFALLFCFALIYFTGFKEVFDKNSASSAFFIHLVLCFGLPAGTVGFFLHSLTAESIQKKHALKVSAFLLLAIAGVLITLFSYLWLADSTIISVLGSGVMIFSIIGYFWSRRDPLGIDEDE